MKKYRSIIAGSIVLFLCFFAYSTSYAAAICSETVWSNSSVYVGGNTVSHINHNWEAKWWTRGEEPGTTGQWGVWRDLGECTGGNDNPDDGDDNNNQNPVIPDNVFAPYVDILLYPTFSINDAYSQTGQKFYTLAFIISGNDCEPAWGGVIPLSDQFYKDEINSIRRKGGNVIVSFGGANGTELAMCKGSVSELQAAYQSVIDMYQLTWVDFDIEGHAVADKSSIDLRNRAIRGLQSANPDLKVAFCLPVLPQGLTREGLYVLENAIENNVRIDTVNVMAMDYGDWAAPDPEGNMGNYAIDAARNTYQQMQHLGLNSKVGITPMLGQNDVASERFYIDDAKTVMEWATSTDYINLLSMWSSTRDNGNCPGQLSANCSGIEQELFAFTNTFFPFTDKADPDPPDNKKPIVKITSPLNGDTFQEGDTITLSANASDSDGTVVRVEFLKGTESLGVVEQTPYAIEWNDVPKGTYTVSAIAEDDDGATRSASVSTTVTGDENGDNCGGLPVYPEEIGSYQGGDRVLNNGGIYVVKPWPYSGWANTPGAYEPGVGFAWNDAWLFIDACGTGDTVASSAP